MGFRPDQSTLRPISGSSGEQAERSVERGADGPGISPLGGSGTHRLGREVERPSVRQPSLFSAIRVELPFLSDWHFACLEREIIWLEPERSPMSESGRVPGCGVLLAVRVTGVASRETLRARRPALILE